MSCRVLQPNEEGLMKRALKLAILASFVCLIAAVTAFAQTSASVVSTRSALSVDKVKQGARFQAAVVVDITGGYHINSRHPSETYLIPTVLKLDKPQGVTPGLVIYPKGQMKKFTFSEKPLSVYEGRAVLKFAATASPALAIGNHSIHGK